MSWKPYVEHCTKVSLKHLLGTLGLLFVMLSLLTVPVFAQDTPPIPEDVDTSAITDDQVNAIANQLYCPVCENIPLDTCGTAACEDWRQEIRGMLAAGLPEADIIDNFVTRFGDRVVSSPRDPVISAISVITPWLVLLVAMGFAIYQLFRWNTKQKVSNKSPMTPDVPAQHQRYLDQLEQDLAGK